MKSWIALFGEGDRSFCAWPVGEKIEMAFMEGNLAMFSKITNIASIGPRIPFQDVAAFYAYRLVYVEEYLLYQKIGNHEHSQPNRGLDKYIIYILKM